LDAGDLAKYVFGTSAQVGLIALALRCLDAAGAAALPAPCAAPVFAFLSLRSRVFSCLDNRRPDRASQGGAATPQDTKRPRWTPPGIAFPIIWSTITLLRTISATMVWVACGKTFTCVPLLALMAHLSMGDTWNSITNAERRLGVSFLAVFGVLSTVYWTVYQFYQVKAAAGLILLPSAVWITIATVLTGTIWRINKPLQPLWPVKGDGKSASMVLPFSSFKR